jgi:hypothetical protein
VRPEAIVRRTLRGSWSGATSLSLLLCEDGSPPAQATSVRVAHDGGALLLRFDCEDRDIWATHTRHDAPLWEEEVVEVFLAPGRDVPREYVELEVNPLGAVFDAWVVNPDGRRDSMRVDVDWRCPGLVAGVDRGKPGAWSVELAIPWGDLCGGAPPPVWRANFFRIERPRDGAAEFCCWSPTFASPPDFHKPAHFGTLLIDGRSEAP